MLAHQKNIFTKNNDKTLQEEQINYSIFIFQMKIKGVHIIQQWPMKLLTLRKADWITNKTVEQGFAKKFMK